MKFTRDGWVWTVGLVSALVTAAVTQFGLLQSAFGVGDVWNDRLKVLAVVIAIVTAKLGFSPLPASPTASQKDYTSTGPGQ